MTRDHLFRYIDEQLVAGYKVATINHDLHTFQGTLRFLQQQGMAVPHQLLTLPGLKKPQRLPRFLTDAQVVALRDDLRAAGRAGQTPRRPYGTARLDLAAFYLLWQSGIRVSELEDLRLAMWTWRLARCSFARPRGFKDRSVYLTERVAAALQRVSRRCVARR